MCRNKEKHKLCGGFFPFLSKRELFCITFVNNVNNHPECIVYLCGFRDGGVEIGRGGDPYSSKAARLLKCEAIFSVTIL